MIFSATEGKRPRGLCSRLPRTLSLGALFFVAVLLPDLVSVGSAGAAQGAITTRNMVPMVLNCGMGKALVRPKELTLACADANDLANDLAWSKWGTARAYATGVDTWNTCVPNCASSKKWDSASADFTLSDAVHTSKGLLFERLGMRITGRTPKDVKRTETYSLAPVAGA
jgi:hypothetical protein